jgi:hypothetical protein
MKASSKGLSEGLSEGFKLQLNLSEKDLEELYLKTRNLILNEYKNDANKSKKEIKNEIKEICKKNKLDSEEIAKEILYFKDKEFLDFAKQYGFTNQNYTSINNVRKSFQTKVKNIGSVNSPDKFIFLQPLPELWKKRIPANIPSTKETFEYISFLEEKLINFQEKFPKLTQWDVKQALGWDFEYTPNFWKTENPNNEDFTSVINNLIKQEFENKPDRFYQSLGLALNNKDNDNMSNVLKFVKDNKNFKNIDEFKNYILDIIKKVDIDTNQEMFIPQNINELDKIISDKLSEYNTLLDREYNNLFSFSSKAEKEMIGVIRSCGLNCVPSRMTLPKPSDFTGVKHHFIIDFMMYCPVLFGEPGNYRVEPRVILVGEYYGLYKPLNEDKRVKILQEINELENNPNLSDVDAARLKNLKRHDSMGGAYSIKTEAKIASEKFIANSIGCDTISIFPGPPKQKVKEALDAANVIYDLDGEPGKAKEKILNNPELLRQFNKIKNDANNIVTYLEAIKTQVKAHYFNSFISEFKSDYTIANLNFMDTKMKTTGEIPVSARKIRTSILNAIGANITPENLTQNFSVLIERYLMRENEGCGQRINELNNLINNNSELSISSVKDYAQNNILNFKKSLNPFIRAKSSFNLKKVMHKQSMNYEEMDKIKILKHLVRLSQISEEIEDTNPEAANLIDKSVEEESNKVDEFNPTNFPAIATPIASSGSEDSKIQDAIQEDAIQEDAIQEDAIQLQNDERQTTIDEDKLVEDITQEVTKIVEQSKIDLTTEDGQAMLKRLVDHKVNQALKNE